MKNEFTNEDKLNAFGKFSGIFISMAMFFTLLFINILIAE